MDKLESLFGNAPEFIRMLKKIVKFIEHIGFVGEHAIPHINKSGRLYGGASLCN